MRSLIVLICIITLAACGPRTKGPAHPPTAADNANYYLNLAKQSSQPEKSEYLLAASKILIAQERFLEAQETLSYVDPEYLSPTGKESYWLYYGHTLLQLQQTEAALTFLQRISQPQQHDIDWQIFYRQTLSLAYLADSNYYEAAKIRIELEDLLLTEEQITENHRFIWDALGQLSDHALLTYSNDLNNPLTNGWLEIASITRNNRNTPDLLLAHLEQWRLKYPTHPANIKMPEELSRIAQAKTYKPNQIALLLPLSGRLSRSGRMIRDGFLAAHYATEWSEHAPIVKIYDTSLSLSPLTPYQQALEEGADFIVGPLTKEAVEQVTNQEFLPKPMLSLNRVGATAITHPELYQFGLPIEDETVQIAQRSIENGHKTAVVVVPASEQGNRIVQAFTHTFEELEGKVAEVQQFANEKQLKNIVKELLNINNSETRKQRLQQLLGTQLEYVQRRRQDADMIFIAATPDQGRRLKPFLNYYFAHDLPVYSISSINNGTTNSQLNVDLNGITFTDSPLLISKDEEINALREQLTTTLPMVKSPFGRLFALGFDAYQLIPELNKLQSFSQYKLAGLTGQLTVNENGEVKRTLSLAEFKRGVAREITQPTVQQATEERP
ncbi:penicillin-binding protein activator [Pleionea sp. CnH1-48]|uniref:penicillin-binding protein activator n=1 Tax=Pleionea sp. CnH1-48 TaxID=2954494 RepID=UPI002096D16A|nr:penicillin-binding protein activator [Pleionea sp. CnH1-48]MCO7224005.1 penicillin-binding protein activator [Pleionea sp. CnH1-48]